MLIFFLDKGKVSQSDPKHITPVKNLLWCVLQKIDNG